MKGLIGVLVLCFSTATALAQEIDWDLRSVSFNAAKEIESVRKQGGDSAAIKTIESCYGSIAGDQSWNARSARCFVLDLTGSALAYKEAKDAGKNEYNTFFKDNGGVFVRSGLPLGQLNQMDLAVALRVSQEGLYEALPYLKKKQN